MNARSRHERSCRGLLAVVLLRPLRGHTTLGQIVGERSAVAALRIAVAAAGGALEQEALARAQLIAARRRRHMLLRGAELDDEARAAPSLAAVDARGRKAALVVAADDGRVFEQLVFASQ